MSAHLIEFEAFDVFEFIDNRDQRLGDNPPGKPRREQAGGENQNG